jgi:hypothetical protein
VVDLVLVPLPLGDLYQYVELHGFLTFVVSAPPLVLRLVSRTEAENRESRGADRAGR